MSVLIRILWRQHNTVWSCICTAYAVKRLALNIYTTENIGMTYRFLLQGIFVCVCVCVCAVIYIKDDSFLK